MNEAPTRRPRSERFAAYKAAEATRTEHEREEEILRHLPLVHSVVERVMANLPRSVERDDLFHAGVIGLMDALERFDASRENAFSTYAVLRIRGAVIDELRARDWVPRGARQRSRDYQQAVAALHRAHGRLPTDDELAAELGVSVAELGDLERDAQLASQVSLETPVGEESRLGNTLSRDDEFADPARHLARDDQRRLLLAALEDLKEQERVILKLYYFEGLLMKEIAAVVGVTESRICQIHGRLMALLRSRLQHAGVD